MSKRPASPTPDPPSKVAVMEVESKESLYPSDEAKAAAIAEANRAFGAEDDFKEGGGSQWNSASTDLVVAPSSYPMVAYADLKGRPDISQEIARAIGAASCYYQSVKGVGDLGVKVIVKQSPDDPAKSFTNVVFDHRPSQSFCGSSTFGLAVLMPIGVRFNYLGMPLGTVNSTNSNIKKGEGGGKLSETQLTGGTGSLLGLPCDCEGGQNVIMKDAMHFLYTAIEIPCHRFMDKTGQCPAGWKHYCDGDAPNIYWFTRLFYKIDPKKDLDAFAKIKDNSDAYNKKDEVVMKRIRPHKLFAEDLELRRFHFVEPVMYRLPMKPERDNPTPLWKVDKDGRVYDLYILQMPIQQQASTDPGGDLTMEMITPDTIESGAKTGPNKDDRLHNRYKSTHSIWIGSLSTLTEFRGTTLLELLEFLKGVDPPRTMGVDEMFNLDTRTAVVETNEDLFKKMLKGVVI